MSADWFIHYMSIKKDAMKLALLSLFLINSRYYFLLEREFIFYIILPFHWNFCQNVRLSNFLLYLFCENPESPAILGFVFIFFIILTWNWLLVLLQCFVDSKLSLQKSYQRHFRQEWDAQQIGTSEIICS